MPTSTSEKQAALRVGPVALDERIDPSDPDEVGQLAGRTRAAADALTIINENRRNAERFGGILSLPPDHAASETLDHDEVAKEAGVTIEGASVRGTAQKVVLYTTRVGDPQWGRSVKGMIPYDGKLPKSQKAYEARLKREEEAREAAEAVSDPGISQGRGGDPRVSQLERELRDLRDQMAERDRREQAQAKAVSDRKDPEQTAEQDAGTGSGDAAADKKTAAKRTSTRKAPAKRKAATRKPAAKK